jgi:hypothetical protein
MTTDCDHAVDIDVGARQPLRLGIDCGATLWLDRPARVLRVRAPDLRTLSQRVTLARQGGAGHAVLADIEVAVAGDARSAREGVAAAGGAPDHEVLQYVGTVAGLAGLVSDLYVLGLADGAVLIPIAGPMTGEQIRADLLRELCGFLPLGS